MVEIKACAGVVGCEGRHAVRECEHESRSERNLSHLE
jgi:hypothetical protein